MSMVIGVSRFDALSMRFRCAFDADDSGRCGFSGVLRDELFDLLPGDTADFDAFCAASLAAQESNSGFGRFQNAGEEFDQGLVGAIFQGGRILMAPAISPAISSLRARGWTRTVKIIVPLAAFSMMSSTAADHQAR
jgi:hypothetical protein